MNEYYEYSKDFEKELDCEMEKWSCGEKTPEVLHNIKDLLKVITLLQEKEAGEAMREYLEDEYGYDSHTGDFRERMKYNPYSVYNMADPKRTMKSTDKRTPGYRRDDYRMMEGNYPTEMENPRRVDDKRLYESYPEMRGIYNHADSSKIKDKLTEQDIKKWMDSLESDTGEKGPMWTREEVEAVAKKDGVKFDKFSLDDLYAAMNMLYSDFSSVGEQFGVDKPGFYLALAKNFLVDADFPGGEDEGGKKLALYYHDIVKE